MTSNVLQFPKRPLSIDVLARDFVSRLVDAKPSPFGRYGAVRLDDGTIVSRHSEPPGADAAYWYLLKWEGRELFISGGRATYFREHEPFWREWLTERRGA